MTNLNAKSIKREPTAPTPPMGRSYWNNHGCDIKEAEFRSQVDYAASKLSKVGYQYMTINISWYSPSVYTDPRSSFHHPTHARHDAEMDDYGRLLPSKNKLPSAANGSFKPLPDYVHSKILKFGLHIMRGIAWKAVEKDLPILEAKFRVKNIANPADVCPRYNATYGVDMSRPEAQEYYNSIIKLYAFWGVNFIKVDDLSMPYHADVITTVRIAKSPIIISNDLTQNDAFTDSILSNEEVIAVNQNSINQRQVVNKNEHVIWESSSQNRTSKYAASFNLNDADERVLLKFEQIGLKGKYRVRDLWANKELGVFEYEFASQILQHSAGMYKITPLQ